MKVVCRMLAAVLAAPALFLTSCSDDTNPGSHWPTTTHSPTPSATATAPPQRETAEHFIQRFYDAERRMEETGKTAPYAALIRGCGTCHKLIRQVRRIYGNGGYIHWGGVDVLSVKVNGKEGDGTPIFEVEKDSAPTRYRESASGPVKTLSGGHSRVLIAIDRHGSSWLVNGRSNLS